MHPAQGPFPRVHGKAALDEGGFEAVRLELSRAPEPRERPALVDVALGLNSEGACNLRLTKDHERISTSGMGTTSWPPHSLTKASCSAISSLMFQGRTST